MILNPCFHCGLPNPSRPLSLIIDDAEQYFCCQGCHCAAETIISSGLVDFYRFHKPDQQPVETTLTNRQRQALEVYNQADIQSEFVTDLLENSKRCILIIEGISCSACSWLIEKRLKQLDGIKSAIVNASTHRLTIEWDNSTVPLSEVFFTLVLIGYRALPYLPSEEEQVRQRTQKQFILRLGIAGVGMMQAMMTAVALYSGSISSTHELWLWWTGLFVTIPVILISARPFFTAAINALKSKQLTMDVSVSIAILGAFFASVYATIIGHGEVYYESVNMFTFFLVLSRFFEFRARSMASNNGNSLIGLPRTCAFKNDDNSFSEVSIKDLKPGDIIQLMPGETCPIDGLLLDGETTFNESSLSGEFAGVQKSIGDPIHAGTTNQSHRILITVEKSGAGSSFNLLKQLVERAGNEKTRIAELADRGSRQFIWTTLMISALIGIGWYWYDPSRAFWVVISVLVVTCPCALSLATPTAIAQATLNLKTLGFVITRGYVLERLASLTDIVFDKTGTLTEGRFAISLTELHLNLNDIQITKKDCLEIAANLESASEHSIARAFDSFNSTEWSKKLTLVENVNGSGVQGLSTHGMWRLGSKEFTQQTNVVNDENTTAVFLTLDHKLVATFHLSDPLRSSCPQMFQELQKLNITSHSLSGDPNPKAERLLLSAGLSGIYKFNCTPEEKVTWLKDSNIPTIAVVGDGLNDAPLLASAPLSIAMLNATDLTKSQADVLLLSNNLQNINHAITLAQKTNKIIRQNLAWALVYNAVALPLAALGLVSPWQAAIGMSASSLLVVGNALRLRK